MSWKPEALRRKVIEVSPELMILWAGDYGAACRLGRRAIEWFRAETPTQGAVEEFLHAHYRGGIPNFFAIVASPSANWLFVLGDVERGESESCGEYAVSGRGAQMFRELADKAWYHQGDQSSADLIALRLANELMTKEISTGETICFNFGAGYEIICRGARGFERVDDVLHCFSQIIVEDDFLLRVAHYPHLTRHWYDGDRLYIASLSTMEAAREGLKSQGFIVPSILDEAVQPQPERVAADLGTRPKYLGAHVQFHYQGRMIPATATFTGDVIDRYLRLTWEGSTIHFEWTLEYIEMLRDRWSNFLSHSRTLASK
jgi:hypothetical protein